MARSHVKLVMRTKQFLGGNMDSASNSMILMSLLGLLLAPLLYALRTLLGMQRKIMYPILRIKGDNGVVMTIVQAQSENPSANRASVRRLFVSPAKRAELSNKEV